MCSSPEKVAVCSSLVLREREGESSLVLISRESSLVLFSTESVAFAHLLFLPVFPTMFLAVNRWTLAPLRLPWSNTLTNTRS